MKRILLAALLVLASCGQSGTPDVSVSDAWARATAPGDLGELVHEVVVDQVAQLLGLDPDVVDPPD